MKNIVTALLCLLPVFGFSQTPKEPFDGKKWQPPYSLPAPQGWGVERFQLPPGFAPEIKYTGVEDIRFKPGWAKIKTDEYWSYSFLWWLDGSPKLSAKIFRGNLKAYYSGLLKVNTDPKKIPAGGFPETQVHIKKIATAGGDDKTFSGTIEIIDYMQLQPIVLNFLIHCRQYQSKNKTVIFSELSPKPFSDNVWVGLNKLWADFTYE